MKTTNDVRAFCEKIKQLNIDYNLKQKEIEKKFKYSQLNVIPVNFLYKKTDSKKEFIYGYIEDDTIPDIECCSILLYLKKYIFEKKLLSRKVEIEITFKNEISENPISLLESYKIAERRWELLINGATIDTLEKLLIDFHIFPSINRVPISVFSEF